MAVGLRELRQTKIENLHSSVVGDKDVVGFEIAMDDSFLVCCRQTVCDLQCVINSASLAQGSTANSLAKCFSFQQLGDNLRCTIICSYVVDH